jgi:deoxyribodipyrimidine photo-lyase
LDRAIAWAKRLDRPLWVLEAVSLRHPWASERVFAFVRDGMRDNAARFARSPIGYFPYIESGSGHADGLLAAFAREAAVVITDEVPTEEGRRLARAAERATRARVELVDGNGLVPLRAPALSSERVHGRAVDFRRWLQRTPSAWLFAAPRPDPLRGLSLRPARRKPEEAAPWRATDLRRVNITSMVYPRAASAVDRRGGDDAARRVLGSFVREHLDVYGERRNDPDEPGASGLSPYLHFGHIGTHQILNAVAKHESWDPDRIAAGGRGARQGWWNMRAGAEAFMDQLVTWRELGHVFAHRVPNATAYASLPGWARATLDAHSTDPRQHRYDLAELEEAGTHDAIWNAAQRELVRTGTMHNYLRMLWGKKILEWSRTPREALATMFTLNDTYALDGRDPNSTSGITWCLGRFDRAWGPMRPIFGTIRYMSSENTRRKLRLKRYLERNAE